MCGVIGATEVTMGMIALPAMIRRQYHPTIACGSILAGGTLIPPSILAILFAVIAQQSVGELFIGAVVPGLILSGLYIVYVATVTTLKPSLGPPLPKEERVSAREKVRLLSNMFAPLVLVALVLGIIFAGIATPVEAAGVGTFGALVVAAMHRRLTIENIRSAAITTLRVTGMVLWIIFPEVVLWLPRQVYGG
jgi:TRAP-type mannitol/chloroaromatic compound transport system permease large subunit